MDAVMNVLPGIFFVALFILIVFWAIKYEQKKMREVGEHFQKFANKFGLTYVPEDKSKFWNYKYPMVIGLIDEHLIKLYTYKTGGKNKTIHTDLSIKFKGNPFNFRIVKEQFFQKIGKALGGQDIQIGHEELDRLFVFKSDFETEFIKMIDAEVIEMLLHLHPQIINSIDCKYNDVNFNIIGHIDTAQKLEIQEKVFMLMLKLVKKIPQE